MNPNDEPYDSESSIEIAYSPDYPSTPPPLKNAPSYFLDLSLEELNYHGCCICHGGFESNGSFRTVRPPYGVYAAKDLMTKYFQTKRQWWCLYRMILYNHRTRRLQVSGVAYNYWKKCNEVAVPLDPHQGVVKYTSMDESQIVAPIVANLYDRVFMPYSATKTYGYPLHARCWELLCGHRMGRLVDTDLKRVFHMLLWNEKYWLEHHEFGSEPFHVPYSEDEDPRSSRCIRFLINRARRIKGKTFGPQGHVDSMNRLCCLPWEVVHIIASDLPLTAGIAFQEAINVHLGNLYWRSRIPTDLFPEVTAVWCDELDWEFLCLELDSMRIDPGKLITRKYILGILDNCLDDDRDSDSDFSCDSETDVEDEEWDDDDENEYASDGP